MIPSLVQQLQAAASNTAGRAATDKAEPARAVPPSDRSRARLLQRLALGYLAAIAKATVSQIHAANADDNTSRGWAYYMTVLVSLGYVEVVQAPLRRGRPVATPNTYRITAMGRTRLAELTTPSATDNDHQEH